jgi:hypothetical protein
VDNEILAIVLTFAVHVLAVGALIWHLFRTSGDDGEAPDWRGWFRDPDAEPPLEPRPSPGRGGLPLPDAVPSAVRLREPARLADAHPRPARRPAHTPEPQPQRAREPA